MNRWLALCALAAALFGPFYTAAAVPAGKRPNILFIFVDDQSPFDFKFYNPKSSLPAPNIERFAAEGLVLDGAFTGAVGTPSRHMIDDPRQAGSLKEMEALLLAETRRLNDSWRLWNQPSGQGRQNGAFGHRQFTIHSLNENSRR